MKKSYKLFHPAIISTVLAITVFIAFLSLGETIVVEENSNAISKKSTDEYVEFSEKKKRVKGVEKFDSPDKFFEYHQQIRTGAGETKPSYPPAYQYKELTAAKARSLSKSISGNFETQNLDWVERGPANVGGRTRGLVVDVDDPTKNTWFAGSVGGGVWKTTDAGVTWRHLTESLPNLATTVIDQALSNPDVLYVGTGEGFGNVDAIQGNGMFKSTDRGETWSILESTTWDNRFEAVNRLAIDPANENIVVVATNTGIYRTTDGGNSFTEVYSSSDRVQDLRANPLNYNTMYAAANGLILKSTDAGLNWSLKNIAIGRTEISISPADTNIVYASVDASRSEMYATFDNNESWQRIDEAVLDDINGDGQLDDEYIWLGAQGWYDNTIAAHPYDPYTVFMGGIDLWKAEITVGNYTALVDFETTGFDQVFRFSPISGLSLAQGGIGSGNEYWREDLFPSESLKDVEVRFGPGKGQKARSFANNTVAYNDYRDVPFEVWDTQNGTQLMASYIDRNSSDPDFNLTGLRGDVILIHDIAYDASNASSVLAQNEGAKNENIAVVSLRNASGVSWDPNNLPEVTIKVLAGQKFELSRHTTPVTDGYDRYAGFQPDIHVDHHNLVMIPVNEATNSFRILNSNDGGVAISDDGGVNWRETDENGYNTSQFYGADKKPGANEYIGGMQDNGTWQTKSGENSSASSQFEYRIGGDGYETAWNYADGDQIIGGSQFNRLRRTINGGRTWINANNGFTDWGNSANSPFISKIASSKIDPDLVFTISRNGVWRSDNFAASWELIPISANNLHSGAYFSQAQIKISVADPNVVWAAAYMSSDGSPHVSKDGGVTFSKTNNYTSVSMGRVSGFETHPTDLGTAYALFAAADRPKVLKTTNYGQSWSDISGFGTSNESSTGFPDVPVYSLLVMPHNTDIIWAGTDIGLVESTDGGATWQLANNGFPSVSIWQMKIVDDQVVVATHGRGIWSVTLPELANYNLPDLALAPRIIATPEQEGENVEVRFQLRSQYDSLHVMIGNDVSVSIANPDISLSELNAPITSYGSQSIQLVGYRSERAVKSYAYTLNLFQDVEARIGYVTDFETSADDFLLDGFTIEQVSGFSNNAAHSPHPHGNQTNLTMQLKIPIIVSDQNAILEYDDVAIIEPGESGTVFGDSQFWDYVIVEGKTDGDWIPLLDGYDARSNSTWLSTYNSNGTGNESMFVRQSINLLDFFNSGDEVSIRFRLYADELTVGWGWAIDNLSIQGSLVGVEDQEVLPTSFELSQNYPNPFNPSTTIKYAVPQKTDVSIKIYNSVGELVTTLVNEVKPAGNYEVNWNANVASGIYFYRIDAGEFNSVRKMVLLK
jgi:photosystem II stability/assembly factor-like uncharacterized protein